MEVQIKQEEKTTVSLSFLLIFHVISSHLKMKTIFWVQASAGSGGDYSGPSDFIRWLFCPLEKVATVLSLAVIKMLMQENLKDF